jgi:hypothetical protein
MRRGLSRYIGLGPGESRKACESLKSPIALATEGFFLNCFLHFGGIFSTIFSLFRKNNYVKFT